MRLTTDALTKRYDEFELSIPDFEIEPGTAVGLVGNNGAGKTTFLRLALDLIRADDGEVMLDGDVVADVFDWKTRTGSYLGPSFLIDFLTPDEYWHFVWQTYDLDEATVNERLARFEDFYVDEPIGDTTKYICDLSTGNKNKAGLVAALLPEPDLLVFDEPFASLDPRSQIQLKEILQARRGDATMLVSSHDLGHVTDVSDRIAILEGGEIVRDEPTDPDTLEDLRTYFAEAIRPKETGPADAEA
ncbi:ATP-binding cassette domain-containing protein [Salinibacter altiplanensis]|uniref:ATP-binding cassette domain-containing protein n=1 Tax=Salinibacter altiplanensis TaxID=1803181 RepID=UPI000C9FA7EB|nr:ABC transporter ATP-binding protein [Salinibacter altiplanensis]